MSKKTIVLSIIIVGLIIFGIYQKFIKKEQPHFTLFEVIRGNVFQEVSETGTVRMGEEINLSFKNAGKIENISVKVGDSVESGQGLARQDTSQFYIQFQEAQASLKVSQAKLDKLLAGSTKEEIKVAETNVKDEEIDLETAQENLDQAYEDALNTLDDSYLKIYNAFNKADDIQRTYFTNNDSEGIKVKESSTKIENTVSSAEFYLNTTKDNTTHENIDIALSEMVKSLDQVSDELAVIRDMCEQPLYRKDVSSTDKASIDTHRDNINTALTNITNTQQTISLKKLSFNSAEVDLQAAQDQLALVLAKPQQEDIDLYEAQIAQAQAQISLIENKIRESMMTSPTRGQITEVAKKTGEMVQAAQTVMSLIPENPFQIEVEIYEEDIVKVDIGDPVDVTVTAFPNNIFLGRVVSIDPTEKLIEGIVYYEVTIDFEIVPEKIKPGMTADLVIKTDSRENVLFVPEEALEKEKGKTIVRVLLGETSEVREIETGLIGSETVEILSGLEEGEQVIIE